MQQHGKAIENILAVGRNKKWIWVWIRLEGHSENYNGFVRMLEL